MLPVQQIAIVELGATPTPERCAELLAPRAPGTTSVCCPTPGARASRTPGALLVATAHGVGITVVPFVGPSSVLLALMASGMNGQGFTFHGYLPVKTDPRAEAIRRLEADSQRTGYAQLFIETPYRNPALLAALVATCRPRSRLCVAVDLTLATEARRFAVDPRVARP